MSYEALLDHTCDIYHIERADRSPGYSLPTSPAFGYAEAPDLAGVPCHFNVKSGTLTIVQGEPQARLDAKVKLNLPVGTDVRINDKIVDCATGLEYTAEVPRNIRDHHVTVMLHRASAQEAL